MPEPLEEPLDVPRAAARAELGLDLGPGARLAVAPGRQDARKGVDRLLDAWDRLRRRPADRLLLLGALSPLARARLDARAPDGSVLVRDGYVAERELLLGLAAADLVVLPYRTPYQSSGLLLRAAAHGAMVLTSHLGWLGATVRAHRLGIDADVADASTLVDAFARAMDAAPAYRVTPGARAFLDGHRAPLTAARWTASLADDPSGVAPEERP